MKFRKAYLLIIIGLFAAIHTPQVISKNSFLVAPGRVMFDLSRPKTQSFIITNNGDEAIRLNIKVVYFSVDSSSLGIGFPLNEETAKIEDLKPYLRVSPPRLSLKPGQRRDIRISIRPPSSLTEGTYRSHLLVSMMEVAETITDLNPSEGSGDVGMHLSLKMETAVAIYGEKGQGQAELQISCVIDAETGDFNYKITNPSPWRFDGWVRAYSNEGDKKVIQEDRLTIMRESTRSIISKSKPTADSLFLRWSDLNTEELIGSANCPIAQ
ncbi:MAG: hypothetical protein COB04_09245 [Gammaproteobacteria bacterium]|nr:MAG: hypothetical protein COB04_09245 [Gammaproteobacteria bacterium]